MKQIKAFKIFFIANFLSVVLVGISVKANCISDLQIQQLRFHANLNTQQIEKLVDLVQKEEPAKGWEMLGTWGDPYAAIAAKVLSENKSLKGSYYNNLIAHHWIQANGIEKYKANFLPVAKQHFGQYVSILQTTGNWPDSDQILMSYLKAVRDHGLKDITVFDAAWDSAGMNSIRPWQKLNHLEPERTVFPTNVCFNINKHEAKKIIRSDLLHGSVL
ncbi:MAG: hypothetical protein ACXVCP_11215 [Bdellovibrio sp.]